MVSKAIDNLTLWKKRGGVLNDFYYIFKIPFPNELEVDEAIEDITEAFRRYDNFQENVNKDELQGIRYQSFSVYSADIFGYLAIAIKLAGEGYMGESLSAIRSSIDIFITSLFVSLIWEPTDTNAYNPLAQLDSPYYHLLKEISLDDLIINRIGLGEEKEGVLLKDKINEASSLCLKDYLEVMNADRDKIDPRDLNNFRKSIIQALTDVSINALKTQGSGFKEIGMELTKPEELLMLLMHDERYTYKACEKCEDSLLNDLKHLLGIGGEMTEEIRKSLNLLTFKIGAEEDQEVIEEKSPICDYCGESPVSIWSIHVRFDKNSMLRYLRWHMDKDSLNEINECVGTALGLEKKEFFGDVVNYRMYRELNPYIHGDPKQEPDITEWYSSYMKPYLGFLTCIFTNMVRI